MTVEGRTRNPQTHPELFELPIVERFAAWNIRLSDLERERIKLFNEGEHILKTGLTELGQTAIGDVIDVDRDGYQTIRQQLRLPEGGRRDLDDLPEALKFMLRDIYLREYSQKSQSELWLDIVHSEPIGSYTYMPDKFTLGGRVGNESFELMMQYKKQATYYLDHHRPDNEIATFSGNSTRGFERNIDRFKDLNRADANTKLGTALAFVKLVADLKS